MEWGQIVFYCILYYLDSSVHFHLSAFEVMDIEVFSLPDIIDCEINLSKLLEHKHYLEIWPSFYNGSCKTK